MIIGKKYELICKIGNGAFGSIYKGKNIRTGESVAIKMEQVDSQTKLLKNETKVYQYLSNFNYPWISDLKYFGLCENTYYLVLNLLGPSLSKFKIKHTNISLDIVLSIGIQMLDRLKFLHNKGLIHRDIKPDNFLLGTGENKNKLYLIDFGFCKKYINDDGKHMDTKMLNNIIGTPHFISLNVHNLIQPSRRDDIESIIYVLIYLWNSDFITIKKRENNEIDPLHYLKNIKTNLINNDDLHNVFKLMLENVRKLGFEEEPDYNYLTNLCKEHIK